MAQHALRSQLDAENGLSQNGYGPLFTYLLSSLSLSRPSLSLCLYRDLNTEHRNCTLYKENRYYGVYSHKRICAVAFTKTIFTMVFTERIFTVAFAIHLLLIARITKLMERTIARFARGKPLSQ